MSKIPLQLKFLLFLFVFVAFWYENGISQSLDPRDEADVILSQYQEAKSDRKKLDLISQLVRVIHYSDSAQKYYPEAIRLARLVGDAELEAQNLNRLGVYYRNMNLQEDALKLYEEALTISRNANIPVQIGHSLNNIGQIFFYQDQFEESLKYYREAETKFLEIADKEGLAYNYNGMSLVLAAIGNFEQALITINKAINIREESGNERQLTVSKFNRAGIFMSMGDYTNAEPDIINLYDYGMINDKIRAINALEKLVELKLKTTNYSQAIAYAKEAMMLHKEKPYSESMIEIYHMMYNYYFYRGNLSESKKYLDILEKEKDILNVEKTKNYLAGLTIKKQKDEIAGLYREKVLMEINNRFKMYLLLALFLFAFAMFIALSIYYRSYFREKKNLSHLQDKQKQIEQQASELDRLNMVKDKIFSILAHDLKAPLDSLWGMVKLIDEENLSQSEFEEYLPIISQNLGNNSMLLENLLIWSRSQMKGMHVQLSRLNLNKLVDENIRFLLSSGYYKGQLMENYVAADIEVEADKNMIDIVFRNLLTNALKFTREGDQIIVDTKESDNVYTVCVSDQGTGISEEGLKKLFGKDFHSTSGTHQEKGTGLGLILTKELVQKNKGEIWAESTLGMGSTFCFTLPKL
ncbi:ATP-binding protein [Aquiflexum sp.]|uniref:tetratricopeptide repeat-containing sensor histidine kinase n=1 Tax=Aquiflexum sp. TaxID=1872584 RepID=UPI0035933103